MYRAALLLFLLAGGDARADTAGIGALYSRAEAYLPQNVGKLALDLAVRPTWSQRGDLFWYRQNTPDGWRYVSVSLDPYERMPLFDHAALAHSLSAAVHKPVDPERLPFDSLRVDGERVVIARAFDSYWTITGEGILRQTPAQHADSSAVSPDGQWEAFVRGGNLWLRERSSSAERALTHDGDERAFYGRALPNPAAMRADQPLFADGPADVAWSPDSTRLASYRIDATKGGTLTLVQSTPPEGHRPRALTYAYPLTGDAEAPVASAHVFHVEGGKRVDLQLAPIPILYYYGLEFEWRNDSRRLTTDVSNRGWNHLMLVEADSDSGAVRELISERAHTFIPYQRNKWSFIEPWKEYVWVAELEGWPHLQIIDARSGRVRRQLTSGAWRVDSVPRIDEKGGVIFFVGSGREPGRDPYLRHLYRIERGGGSPRLLTPEPVDHEVHVSPDGRYFIDNMSRADLPTRTVLRRTSDGAIEQEISSAAIDALKATGFVWPEPFETLSADGKTPIHGLIYRPAHFDPSQRYPVIDNIYTGPHYVMAPKTFDAALRGRTANALAQLGFIVVLVDGRGTSGRSRDFLDHAYQRLGEVGLDDHEAAIRSLAKRYPYMDLGRVGVYGFSAGGFDAARALFRKPAFYKVGVAASGNHDHRSDKASWNEMWMGIAPGNHYDSQSNLSWAAQLQGKLLLAHGELDENVHPMATLQLVDALIEANKDFDLLIVPNAGHYLDDSPYYLRRQWDFFVRHLLNVQPPNYRIAPFEVE